MKDRDDFGPGSGGGPELESLLEKARQGDSAAAQELFDKYAASFLTVIRAKLARKLRVAFDSDDFLQEARLELFAKNLGESCATVHQFLHLLERVAINRVLQANRKYLDYQAQNLKRQVPLHRISVLEERSFSQLNNVDSMLIAEEQWELLLRGCSAQQRTVLEMLRQGYTHQEIASKLCVNEKTIRRFLSRTRHAHAVQRR